MEDEAASARRHRPTPSSANGGRGTRLRKDFQGDGLSWILFFDDDDDPALCTVQL